MRLYLSILLLLVAPSSIVVFANSAHDVSSETTKLVVRWFKGKGGTTMGGDQSKKVLDVNKGPAADWDDYIEIVPSNKGTRRKMNVWFVYNLPTRLVTIMDEKETKTTTIDKITITANSQGAGWNEQRRFFRIRNYATRKWVVIGKTKRNPSWKWTEQEFVLLEGPAYKNNLSDYINPKNNQILILHDSNNDFDVVDLDYLAVNITTTTTNGDSGNDHVDGRPFEIKTAAHLPPANDAIAAGNPLRGMLTSPLWTSYHNQRTDIPTSLDFYYIGWDTTMTGTNTFDWSHLESLLTASAAQNRHAIVRFMLDYPNQENYVPKFLKDAGLQMTEYTEFGGGMSPDYQSPLLLTALKQFITALGQQYDGDSRLAFVQTGLLGFWGEWHTYPHNGWLPDATMDAVAGWFDDAFDVTPLQIRYARSSAKARRFGYHDDSFAHSTLSDTTNWFFWPEIKALGHENFWKTAVMGGELRPELQRTAFATNFPNASNEFEQDFDLCVNTTHATYMLNAHAFNDGYNTNDLGRAQASASRLGYQFRVSRVAATVVSSNADGGGTVEFAVDITQTGVAPFYYPLNLIVSCSNQNGLKKVSVSGVDSILAEGDSKRFLVAGFPMTRACLGDISLSLDSPQAYPGNPVRFAQGSSNGSLKLSFTVPI